ncbi:MAG: PIN domain-containing protein [Nitrososphaerota archaeon]|nr:PIN domain-containing protein [Nitrososphaerota archaeon]
MTDSAFVDTSILAYAFDTSDPAKRQVCKDLVEGAFSGAFVCAVSNQVLAELYVVLTQKIAKPLSRGRAGTIVKGFADSQAWTKLNYDSGTVSRAMATAAGVPNHFWDLLIAETMRDGGIRRIFTENVEDFRGMAWIEPVNPLVERTPELGGKRRKGEARAVGSFR